MLLPIRERAFTDADAAAASCSSLHCELLVAAVSLTSPRPGADWSLQYGRGRREEKVRGGDDDVVVVVVAGCPSLCTVSRGLLGGVVSCSVSCSARFRWSAQCGRVSRW